MFSDLYWPLVIVLFEALIFALLVSYARKVAREPREAAGDVHEPVTILPEPIMEPIVEPIMEPTPSGRLTGDHPSVAIP